MAQTNNIFDDLILRQEAYKVLLHRDVFEDSSRGHRKVPVKFYYPSGISGNTGPFPVLFWSHGLGGSVDGASFLSRHIAGHGYVIVHVQHPGTDSSLWEGQNEHPWDIIRKTPISREATLNRFLDVPFVLDHLEEWASKNPEIGRLMDLERLGMSGHSFGALTTQVIGGQVFPDESGVLKSFKDKRFKAGLVYSPVPIDHLALDDPKDIYGSINIPLIHMTGTDDSSPLENYGHEKRFVVFDAIEKTDQHLLVLEDGDHMVFNGSRGKLKPNPKRELHEEMIKNSALIFCDAYLKEDGRAYDWLTSGEIEKYLNGQAKFRFKK